MDFALLHTSEFFWLIVFCIGFLTSFVDTMGGSGGLIVTPFLIASGMPPPMAIGTSKMSSVGALLVAIFKFHKADKIRWDYALKLLVIAVICAAIGASIVVNINKELIYPIVGACLVFISIFGFIKRNLGLENKKHGALRERVGFGLFSVTMVYGGFFGGGTGTFAKVILMGCMGFTSMQSHATFLMIWLAVNITSVIVFVMHGQIDYLLVPILFSGMICGSWVGSHLALKGGDKWVKNAVFIFAFIVGLKFLFL